MMGTSVSICLPAPIAGSGKSGFSALGVAAQEKLYTAEYVPSSPGEWGLIFTLLPLPHAAAGILPSLPETGHRAAVGSGHHCPIGNCKISSRPAPWASSTRSSLRPGGSQIGNLMKPLRKVNYGPQCRQGTRERRP